MLKILPITIFPLLLINLVSFWAAQVGTPIDEAMYRTLFTVDMISGSWPVTVEALLISLTMIALFGEIIRSTHTDARSIANHGVSFLVAIVAILEFVVLRGMNTTATFVLVLATLIDVSAGIAVSIVSARRDFGGHGVMT